MQKRKLKNLTTIRKKRKNLLCNKKNNKYKINPYKYKIENAVINKEFAPLIWKINDKILNEILKNINDKVLINWGGKNLIYYFSILEKTRIEINSNFIILPKAEYIFKFHRYDKNKDIHNLKILSDNFLIPKIYYVDTDFIIMEYIDGVSLADFGYDSHTSREARELVFDRILKLLKRWHTLGFAHGDLHFNNIIIDNRLNVYFIDPNFYGKSIQHEAYYDVNAIKNFLIYP